MIHFPPMVLAGCLPWEVFPATGYVGWGNSEIMVLLLGLITKLVVIGVLLLELVTQLMAIEVQVWAI